MTAKLTEKQKRFCDLYIKYGNAAQAAIEAGYSKRTARTIGQQNLTKLDVKNRIDEMLQKLESERVASADEVLKYLTSVMRGEHQEEVPLLCGDGCQELVPKDVAAKERIKAAELLGKRYSLFTENVNVSGDVGVQIINDIPKNTG